MIIITSNQKIFILCPANFATGGPEALHQLAAQLRAININAFIYYVNYDSSKFQTPIHPEYEKYEVPYVLEVENTNGNWILFPETFSTLIWEEKYKQLSKIIWWLSVTNYHISLDLQKKLFKTQKNYFYKKLFDKLPIPTIAKLKKTKVLHIAHSYFSLEFLHVNKLNVIGQISDYMKAPFLKRENYYHLKEDGVIYNVVKNKGFLEKIIAQTPEINWIPIQNMTNEEVIQTMKKAKVYIDFGYHPGKERMPREACLLDCCLIIGKDGSAKYKEDMPILDEYHFEKKEKYIPEIIAKIKDCIANYDTKIKDFQGYKNVLLDEKITFEKDVKTIFKS